MFFHLSIDIHALEREKRINLFKSRTKNSSLIESGFIAALRRQVTVITRTWHKNYKALEEQYT